VRFITDRKESFETFSKTNHVNENYF
jgi:hypothetical protein